MSSRPEATPGPEGPFCLAFAGNALSVRKALRRVARVAPLHRLTEGDRSTAELVLAEALNNIVEHAYASGPGPIELCLDRCDAGLFVLISDHGIRMPGACAPKGQLPPGLDGPIATLPEGGFGWFLIRSLTRDLCYERRDGQNRLTFTLPIG